MQDQQALLAGMMGFAGVALLAMVAVASPSPFDLAAIAGFTVSLPILTMVYLLQATHGADVLRVTKARWAAVTLGLLGFGGWLVGVAMLVARFHLVLLVALLLAAWVAATLTEQVRSGRPFPTPSEE